MQIKKQLYQECNIIIEKRFEVLQKKMKDIQNALQSETKSTAGDKHETGRAMLQLEREKIGQQLLEVQKLKEVLQKTHTDVEHKIVSLGSVVFTSDKNYYIAISAGQIKIHDTLFYAISVATPIGRMLLSKTEGDEIEFLGHTFSILSVT